MTKDPAEMSELVDAMSEDQKDRPLEPAETVQEGQNKMLVIAIDIDGCALLHPERVNRLFYKKNTSIILHTARPEIMRNVTIKELQDLGIQYDTLKMDKLKASYYIDDKNANFDLEFMDLV